MMDLDHPEDEGAVMAGPLRTSGTPAGSASPAAFDRPARRSLANALQVVPASDWSFSAVPRAGSPGRAFGGELAAQSVLAATATVETSRLLHSAHVQFLAPARPDQPVAFDVARLRDGRTLSGRQVTATQAGRAVLVTVASYQEPSPGPGHQIPTLEVPLPESIPRVAEQLADDPENLAWAVGMAARRGVELRFPEGPGRVSASRGQPIPPVQRVWMRLKEPLGRDPRFHAAVLTGMTDLVFLPIALFPHGLTAQDPGLDFASLNHTVWMHRPFVLDDWILFDQFSDWAGDGRGLCHGRILDRSGALLASVSQEGMMRPHRVTGAPQAGVLPGGGRP